MPNFCCSRSVSSCLVNALKFITFLITTSLNLQQKIELLTLVRSESKLRFADALHILCDWLFAARVTLSGARAPELITNSGSNSELSELCEPADPDLNQVGFIGFCQLKPYSATLSLFILFRAAGLEGHEKKKKKLPRRGKQTANKTGKAALPVLLAVCFPLRGSFCLFLFFLLLIKPFIPAN